MPVRAPVHILSMLRLPQRVVRCIAPRRAVIRCVATPQRLAVPILGRLGTPLLCRIVTTTAGPAAGFNSPPPRDFADDALQKADRALPDRDAQVLRQFVNGTYGGTSAALRQSLVDSVAIDNFRPLVAQAERIFAAPSGGAHASAEQQQDVLRVLRSLADKGLDAAPVIEPLGANQYASRADLQRHDAVDEILRVDHAGEYGAVRIYEGQLAVTRDPETRRMLEEMRDQEVGHLNQLNHLLPQRRARPTVLLPLWDVAGFALGAATALMGKRAAMACTVAVEEVITEHYNDQLRKLNEPNMQDEKVLRQIIRKNRDDEDQHREIGLKNEALEAPFYNVLSSVIKTGCHAAIWLSKRI